MILTDVLTKLASEFRCDSILWGTVSLNQEAVAVSIVVRDLSGKELFRNYYQEELDTGLRDDLYAGQSDFYFAGLDGVTIPECSHCPVPKYTDGARARRIEGRVVLSVLVTPDGNADQLHVLKSLDPDLDRSALDEVKSWHFKLSKCSDGRLVLVRMPVEITFRLGYNLR